MFWVAKPDVSMICFLVLHRNAITQIVCLALLKALAWTVNSVLGCSHVAAELQRSAQKSCSCVCISRVFATPKQTLGMQVFPAAQRGLLLGRTSCLLVIPTACHFCPASQLLNFVFC